MLNCWLYNIVYTYVSIIFLIGIHIIPRKGQEPSEKERFKQSVSEIDRSV